MLEGGNRARVRRAQKLGYGKGDVVHVDRPDPMQKIIHDADDGYRIVPFLTHQGLSGRFDPLCKAHADQQAARAREPRADERRGVPATFRQEVHL